MATIIGHIHIPPLVYAVEFILIGSSICTYILGYLRLDIATFLDSKQGKYLHSRFERIHEQLLKVVSVSDPTTVPSTPSGISTRGYLETLPARVGSRPSISGIPRPKQATQVPCSLKESGMLDRLRDIVTAIPTKYPGTTYLGSSTFEAGGSVSLFARQQVFNETRYYGEIVSADYAGGLVQLTLHPDDVRAVIENGWGQRHPLSTRLASWLAMDEAQTGHAPQARVVVYAPRSPAELIVIEQMIHAAVWWDLAKGEDKNTNGA
ncbi:hypothetical protein HRR78_007354 [Exophiala dermatitidis]|nr:hypothetical protein HRR75_005367 [Exophiala dermatitidis]KAJ4541764.1 hypothetical protein HRR78_007354 [Exophiala dermatitidis]